MLCRDSFFESNFINATLNNVYLCHKLHICNKHLVNENLEHDRNHIKCNFKNESMESILNKFSDFATCTHPHTQTKREHRNHLGVFI